MSIEKKELGDLLKEYRLRMGLTQAQVCARAKQDSTQEDSARSFLSNLERARIKKPTPDKIRRYADVIWLPGDVIPKVFRWEGWDQDFFEYPWRCMQYDAEERGLVDVNELRISTFADLAKRQKDYGVYLQKNEIKEALGCRQLCTYLSDNPSRELSRISMNISISHLYRMTQGKGITPSQRMSLASQQMGFIGGLACNFLPQSFKWTDTPYIQPWLNGSHNFLGLHWIIICAYFSSSSKISDAILNGLKSEIRRLIEEKNNRALQHVRMNILEGVLMVVRGRAKSINNSRDYLLKRDAFNKRFLDLIEIINKILEIENVEKISVGCDPELSLRLAFNALSISRFHTNLVTLGLHDHSPLLRTMSKKLLNSVADDQKVVSDAANNLISFIEVGELDIDFLTLSFAPNGCLEMTSNQDCAKALVEMVKVSVERRSIFSGAGWETWEQSLRNYGRISRNDIIRELSKDVILGIDGKEDSSSFHSVTSD